MKHFILTISIFFLFIAFVNGYAQENGHWEILNEGIPSSLDIVDFVNEQVGWIYGVWTLSKTEDGGETWYRLPIDENWKIHYFDFYNETVGWAIVSDYDWYSPFIVKTTDGGQTWVIQDESESNLHSLCVVNDRTVYVVGDSLKILRTIDGGLSWHDISFISTNFDFLDILFINNYTGFTLGLRDLNNGYDERIIFRTVDGSDTWQALSNSGYTFLGGLQFVNDSTGYIIATDKNWDNYFILETNDRCSSWSIKTQREHRISAFTYLSYDTAYAIMWDEGSSNLMKSTDAGITWEEVLFFNDKSVSSIYFNRNNIGFAEDRFWSEITLYRTNDNGNNWVKMNMSYPFKDVFFINNHKGFAVGGYGGFRFHGALYGDLWFTADGGEAWSKNSNHPGGYITSCTFVNDSIGFTLERVSGQEYSVIHKTADGGNSWKEISPPFGYNWGINDICFIDTQIGLLAGNFSDSLSSGAAIFSTSEYGETWDLIWKYPDTDLYSYNLHSIHAVNTTAWAVGERGLIVKYTEQDQWQLIIGVTDLPLNDVFFSDEYHGWIAGGYFDEDNEYLILLKTTDGGENWQEIPDFDYQINDMFFDDSLYGWAVGNDISDTGNWPPGRGVILQTSDGGDNWNVQVEWNASGYASGVYFYRLSATSKGQSVVQTRKLVLLK